MRTLVKAQLHDLHEFFNLGGAFGSLDNDELWFAETASQVDLLVVLVCKVEPEDELVIPLSLLIQPSCDHCFLSQFA